MYSPQSLQYLEVVMPKFYIVWNYILGHLWFTFIYFFLVCMTTSLHLSERVTWKKSLSDITKREHASLIVMIFFSFFFFRKKNETKRNLKNKQHCQKLFKTLQFCLMYLADIFLDGVKITKIYTQPHTHTHTHSHSQLFVISEC